MITERMQQLAGVEVSEAVDQTDIAEWIIDVVFPELERKLLLQGKKSGIITVGTKPQAAYAIFSSGIFTYQINVSLSKKGWVVVTIGRNNLNRSTDGTFTDGFRITEKTAMDEGLYVKHIVKFFEKWKNSKN